MDPKLLPALQAGFDVLWRFVDRLVIDREKSGIVEEGGLLDRLIAAKNAGELSETELRDLLIVLFVAGYGTSKTMLSVTMHMMLSHPDDWRRCAEDIGFCTKVVEEIFRHTAITNPPRIVAEEFTYDGVRFPKDTMLLFLVSKSGRDPTIFADPMEFRPERVHTHRHMGFGRGAHICLGQHLARVQIVEGIHLIAQRLTNPRLVGEVKWRPFIAGGGVASLPITFEARPARTTLTGAADSETQTNECPVSH
jgi:cytochrome P450